MMKRCLGCMKEYNEELNKCPYCGYEENTPPLEAYHMVPGNVLHGKYIVGRVVGYGGFGVTYIGYDAELERTVAVKEYMPSEFATRVPGQTKVTVYEGERAKQFHGGLEKFVEEARRLAGFQEMDGIVKIYDCFFENETAYIIMEYLEGETLKQKLYRDGKMSPEEAMKVILPIMRSLKEVHKTGIIHRDIAPDNIILTKDGQVKLIDFGAARFATNADNRSKTIMIKMGYAPLEQYNSHGNQGTWTDVYALAATLYKCLTGITPEDSMERINKDDLKAPSMLGVKVGRNIDTAIMNAMNLSVEHRTKDLEEFEKELLAEKNIARILEPEKKEDTGKLPLWLKVAIGAAGAAILVFVILLMTGIINFGKPKADAFMLAEGMTYVPNMINQTIEQAQTLADENSVTIQIVDKQNSDVVPRDLVMSQTPDSGNEVNVGTVMELVISAGKEQVYVPDVVGMMQEEAEAILEENGLTYELTETDSNLITGTVGAQSMEADTQTDRGTCIALTISNGYIPDIDESMEAEIPDLIGMTFREAQELLYENKLFMARTGAEYSSTVSKGCIISQNIEAGAIGHQGDVIGVIVSLGNRVIRVPDVQYKDEAEAIATLEDSGLMVSVHYEESDIVAVGKVISQDLEAGTEVDWNSGITIIVSIGGTEESNFAGEQKEISSTGKEWQETCYSPDGSYAVCEYDADGNMIKDTCYSADGTIQCINEYDTNGNYTRITTFKEDGIINFMDEYDADGNCIKTTYYNEDGTIYCIYERDKNGRTIKTTSYDADGNIVYYSIPEYDSDENLRRDIHYNADGTILWIDEYDADGNIVGETYYNPDGGTQSREAHD